jgi:hypothetical protein
VGLANIRWFILFLISTDILLLVGMLLCWGILDFVLGQSGIEIAGLNWKEYIRLLGLAVVEQVYIGAIFLLCTLCGILSFTFTGYHIYLIWAGTTSNETTKWDEWKEDIKAGIIYLGELEEEGEEERGHGSGPGEHWPRKQRQWLYRIAAAGRTDMLPQIRGVVWQKVEGLAEVDNIYDCGSWANFRDVLWPGKLE